jgi:hypothetical protein
MIKLPSESEYIEEIFFVKFRHSYASPFLYHNKWKKLIYTRMNREEI